jgi:hypothetical protein
MNKEFTVAIGVIEHYHSNDGVPPRQRGYSTVVLVEALDMEEAETKVEEWFLKSDIEGYVRHKIEIIKTLPKIH